MAQGTDGGAPGLDGSAMGRDGSATDGSAQGLDASAMGSDGSVPAFACVSWGDTHNTTFDGLQYNFQQVGEWVMARTSTTNGLSLEARLAPYGTSRTVAVNKAVVIRSGTDRVEVRTEVAAPHTLTVNGVAVAAGSTTMLGGGGQVVDSAAAIHIQLPNHEGLEVSDQGDHLDYTLTLAPTRRGTLRGLCGAPAVGGDTSGEFTKRDGTVLPRPLSTAQLYYSFGASWRLNATLVGDSGFYYGMGENTATFTDLSFPDSEVTNGTLSATCASAATDTCRAQGVSDPNVLAACALDVCATGNSNYANGASMIPAPAMAVDGPPLTNCTSWGDTHITPFAQVNFDFQQVGEWVVATNSDSTFEVQVRQQPLNGSTVVAGNTMVAARYLAGPAVSIAMDGTVRVNNATVSLPAGLAGTGTVSGGNGHFTVLWRGGDRLDVTTFGDHLDYTLGVQASWIGALRGLCGSDVPSPTQQFARRDGSLVPYPPTTRQLYNDFGNAWRVGAGMLADPQLLYYAMGETTATFTDLNFPLTLATTGGLPMNVYANAKAICLAAGVTQAALLDACILDVATTGLAAFAASSASVPPPQQGSINVFTSSQAIAMSSVTAMIFPADAMNSAGGAFDLTATTATTAVFSVTLPSIDLNPPQGTVGNFMTDLTNQRPMVAVTTDVNSSYTGQIVLQGNGQQAGLNMLNEFDMVLEGTLIVRQAGVVELDFYSDDGFIIGIGNGATSTTSSTLSNPPASGLTGFLHLPVVGAYNGVEAPSSHQVFANFPAPGAYPFEVDYTECCGGQLALTLASPSSGGQVIPPIAVLALTPNADQTLPHAMATSFSVHATGGSGAPLAHQRVSFAFSGANAQSVAATTDANGDATISFIATNVGSDTLQVTSSVAGLGAVSNAITISWN
jgi:hypothetical protein